MQKTKREKSKHDRDANGLVGDCGTFTPECSVHALMQILCSNFLLVKKSHHDKYDISAVERTFLAFHVTVKFWFPVENKQEYAEGEHHQNVEQEDLECIIAVPGNILKSTVC